MTVYCVCKRGEKSAASFAAYAMMCCIEEQVIV